MNIFITGGSGFIGHYITNLLQVNNTVTVYDSKTEYGVFSESEVRRMHYDRRKFISGQIITADIRDTKHLLSSMMVSKPSVIIHLASLPRAKVVNEQPVLGSEVMSTALLSLLTQAKMHKVARFVYVSSSMVYGNFTDDTDEDAICNPKGIYGILKYAGELLVKDFCLANNIEYVIVRPSAVYGPRDIEDRVMSKFVMDAIRNNPLYVRGPDEILDFTYVADVAAGIVSATVNPLAANSTFNLTLGNGYSLLDAAKLAVELVNSSSKIVVTDRDKTYPTRGVLNSNRAKSLLGFSPSINLEDGLVQYIKWAGDYISSQTVNPAIPS